MNINQTMKDVIFNLLVEKISLGFYEDGKQLVELDLADEFNVSRSPVREAIRQLVTYDLAVSIPHKGVFVKRLDSKKITEIFEPRNLLENYGIMKVKDSDIDERKKRLDELKEKILNNRKIAGNDFYIELDEELHNLLVDSGNNDTIVEVYHRNTCLVRPFRNKVLSDDKRLSDSIDEHVSLINAILDGNYEAACEINELHLNKALEVIIKTIEGNDN